MTFADRALGFVKDGTTIGLGTGRAATLFVEALGRKVRDGLKVRGVPTSATTAKLAKELGIPLTTLDEVEELDVTFDGADEVAPDLSLIKGYGGALVREKIVAASSKRLIILVGPGKEVPRIGSRGRLPIEVIPFGLALVHRRLAKLGLFAEVRPIAQPTHLPGAVLTPFLTDNGNLILDCRSGPIDDPVALERALHDIPGVVDTGLFLNMAETVLIGHDDGSVQVRHRVEPS